LNAPLRGGYNEGIREGGLGMAGSHITKLALASAMQRLMTEQPFERISVSDICAACGMSRKSFYYHFRDKYDLVGWIFETEFVEPNRERSFSSSWEFFDALCSYFYANRAFYVNAFAMRGQNSFAEYFSEFLRPLASGYFSALFPGKRENSFFTDFFTDAFLVSIIRWLRSPEPMPAQEYVARLKEVVTGIARKVAQEEI
jgi:probable dihydroxyacetone kinase regulator